MDPLQSLLSSTFVRSPLLTSAAHTASRALAASFGATKFTGEVQSQALQKQKDFVQQQERIKSVKENLPTSERTGLSTERTGYLSPNFATQSPEKIINIALSIIHPETENNHARQVAAATDLLPVVRQIRNGLDTKGTVIVYGAPGSGKTEQVDIATHKGHQVLDVKQEFINDYLSKHGITNKADSERLWREGYYGIKGNEREWLSQHFDALKERLLSFPEDTIVLDEFDMDAMTTLGQEGLKTAEIIGNLAKELVTEGKKVILIMHATGLNTPELMSHLKENDLVTEESQIISTAFVPEDFQKQALKTMDFSTDEADRIIKETQGITAAYIPFFKKSVEEGAPYQPTFQGFFKQAHENITKNFNIAKKINSDLLPILQRYADLNANLKEPIILEEQEPALRKTLLDTGLVGLVNDQLVMPPIVREIIHDDAHR